MEQLTKNINIIIKNHKNMKYYFIIVLIIILFNSCSNNNKKSDAYGNFEAEETIISSESVGKILEFKIKEGSVIEKNSIIGQIDTTQLNLKKKQALAQKNIIATKFNHIISNIRVLEEKKKAIEKEYFRLQKLLNDSAISQQKFDKIDSELKIIVKQIEQIKTQNSTALNELEAANAQIELINDQIKRCQIINPVKGTVLNTYIKENELIMIGKPLYKIANLEEMTLKVYIDESQLSSIKLNDEVTVIYDVGKNKTEEKSGRIAWISENAEFTPKIIQTREERVNLVYEVKIELKNNGKIKIGMPGEVIFHKNNKK